MQSENAGPVVTPQFSIVGGGPLFLLWRGTQLADDSLDLVKRRTLMMVLVTWVPLLLFSVVEGFAWTGKVERPFFADFEIHVKLLIALPLLILAEPKVHGRLTRIVNTFVENGLVEASAQPQFDAAIASATRLRNSFPAELMLLAFVYLVGFGVFWFNRMTPGITNWYLAPVNGGIGLSYAGWWALCVSLPLFQFVLLRWYFRLFMWARFLWQVSRIDLQLQPTHPDGTAGMRFLSMSTRAFSVVMLAQGAALSAMMGNKIVHEGATLLDFKVELIGTVALMIFAIIGPLLVFYPKLREAKHDGQFNFGALGQRYAADFDQKWMRSRTKPSDALIGSPDIQSLADLRNDYLIVSGMKPTPFGMESIIHLAIMTLLPVAPLLLTILSVEQLLDRMLKVIF